MQLLRVADRNSREYSDAIAILREAIAPEAQLPEQQFQDLLAGGQYQLFAYVEGEDVQGMALVYFSDELRVAWLDYFAIRSELRGRGLGSKLFHAIVQMVTDRSSNPEWLLFEVDDDYEGDPEREAECARRVRFYRRLGARLLENVPYKFPSAFSEPIRMLLMAYQILGDASLRPDDVKKPVREIFLKIHGRASDDELLLWFEQNLPQVIQMK